MGFNGWRVLAHALSPGRSQLELGEFTSHLHVLSLLLYYLPVLLVLIWSLQNPILLFSFLSSSQDLSLIVQDDPWL